MENLFIDILNFLKDNKLYYPVDLKEFLLNHPSVDKHTVDGKEQLFQLLNEMRHRGFVTIITDSKIVNNTPTSESSLDIPLEEFTSIKLTLSIDGYNFVTNNLRDISQEKLLQRQTLIADQSGQSVIETNILTRKITKKNLYISLITLAFVAVSTWATYQSYRLSNEANHREHFKETQNTQIQLLSKIVKQKSDTIILCQTKIDSLFRILKKHK